MVKMNKRLYFLHIPKTGGINISTSVFLNKNISFFNTSNIKTLEDFYSSKYIYGHMGKTPIEKNPGIDVACLFRNPLERSVSHFIHTYNYSYSKIVENKNYINIKTIEDKLKYYLFEDSYFATVANFQSKSIFNIMKNEVFENMFKKPDNPEYEIITKTNILWYLLDQEFSFEDVKNIVDYFKIIGTTENYGSFFEKINNWFLDNYNEEIFTITNISSVLIDEELTEHTTLSLLNSLTEDEKEKFKNINELDYKLYDYIKNKNV